MNMNSQIKMDLNEEIGGKNELSNRWRKIQQCNKPSFVCSQTGWYLTGHSVKGKKLFS